MADTISSTNMSMPIPVVGVDAGPQYATDLNSCLTIVDSHDHSAGAGVQITPSGININADLAMNSANLTLVRTVRLAAQNAVLSLATDLLCLYAVAADLYYNDGSGNQIRVTQSGALAGTPGSIANLVSPATCTYVSATPSFVFQSAALTPANLDGGSVLIRNITASSKAVTLSAPAALGSNYTIVLPTLPASTKFLSIDSSGNSSATRDVDNVTIELSSNNLQIKDSGVTAAKIASGQITQVKMGSLGQQLSSSSGNFSTSSATFVDVTNLTATITTTGRPVMIALVSDGTVNASYISIVASSSSVISQMCVVRDVTQLGLYQIGDFLSGSASSKGITIPSSSFSYVDVVAAGTYTYKVQATAVSGAIGIAYAKLMVYEL